MRCWKGNGKGGWERRWERVSNGKCRRCRKGVRVLEEGGRGKGRGVVSKGRGRKIVTEKGRRRENWRGRGKGRRERGRGREKGGKKKLDCAFLIFVWYNV